MNADISKVIFWRIPAIVFLFLVMLLCSQIHADEYHWTGDSGNWNDGDNWTNTTPDPDTTGVVPQNDDKAEIGKDVNVTISDSASVGDLWTHDGADIFQSGGNFTVEGITEIGYWGLGTYILTDGAIHATGDLSIGVHTNAVGSYFNSGSVNNVSNDLHLGYYVENISATYELSDNGSDIGELIVGGSEYVGFGGKGDFIQSGGTHTVNNNEYIGFGLAGVFTQSGGIHTVQQDLFLGHDGSGNGTYEMTDGDLTVNNHEYIGFDGTGAFTQSGGTHTVNGNLRIGENAGSDGTYILSKGNLNVTNTRFIWNEETQQEEIDEYAAGYTVIGHNGVGEFNQSDGEFDARVLVLGGGPYAGDPPTSEGTYNMSDGTLSADLIEVGRDDGKGFFNQTGGNVSTDILAMGDYGGGDGEYTISDGVLTVNDKMDIGSDPGGKGKFIQEGGSVITQNTIYLGQEDASDINGIYEMKGGSLTANEINVSQKGQFINSGGSVDALLTNQGIISGNGTFSGNVNNYGTVSGNGIFSGNLYNNGLIAPGQSPGTLTIAGDFFQDTAGELEIELGLDQYNPGIIWDYLDIDGTASLSGTLEVTLLDTIAFNVGDIFPFLHANGGLSGSFSTWYLPILAGGHYFEIGYNYDSYNVFLKVTDGGGSTVVPEPGSMALFGLGIVVLAFRLRKKMGIGDL